MCMSNSILQINSEIIKKKTPVPMGLYITFKNSYSINIQPLHFFSKIYLLPFVCFACNI